MSRFYVRPEDVKGDEIFVSKQEAHHIIDVMRLSAGEKIVAFDGTGKEYIGKILSAFKGNLRIKIEKTNQIKSQRRVSITLAQAIPKSDTMDFIVEKSAELGVGEIAPLFTERTIVRLNEAKQAQKQKHWENIAISVSKQCGRLDIPKIRRPLKFGEFIKGLGGYELIMMACLDNETAPLKKIISGFSGKNILVMVGPEGDFSPGEIKTAALSGARFVSLGSLVLRVDTAAIFILSVVNYENSII